MNTFCFKQPISNILVSNFSQLALAISLSDVKAHLRITFNQEDAYITNLIKTATQRFEGITGIDLITKEYKTFLDNFPLYYNHFGNYEPIKIKRSKLQSIVSIKYYLNEVLTTFASSNYYFTESNNYSEIFLYETKEYPDEIDNRANAVVINFTSGFGTSEANIPFDYKQAIMEYIAFLYKNRGDACCNNMGIASQFFTGYQKEIFI
jgi:uncharacterized phiE125 gp8 family phage protein